MREQSLKRFFANKLVVGINRGFVLSYVVKEENRCLSRFEIWVVWTAEELVSDEKSSFVDSKRSITSMTRSWNYESVGKKMQL
ncbi:hypothetical protein CEXT_565301 [Caerostris extrusa]|uniref:Uncharacterized protein n=1 Tax=Caerostris extrusa TaxID=172846 RepID=A0AAV4TPD8_CAEEX|nr:hypothetical protein CEXT_565301 [Caerostris extrusa]